jgi:DNA-binding winged helix-turn-helix (wHTH) protein
MAMDVAFADCILSLSSRQVRRGGKAVPLEPKMFLLLQVLVERRPAVVTYAQLDELLWPNVYVARTSLTRLVSELRALLGDDSTDAPIIRTVYKTGYAFAADVRPFGDRGPASVGKVPGSGPNPSFSLRFDGRVLPLADGENIAGRDADCNVVVDTLTVSRRHARFVIALRAATVEDLASTNGTFVNGVRITQPSRVADGDEIALGKALLQLRIVAPSAPTEMMTQTASARGNDASEV